MGITSRSRSFLFRVVVLREVNSELRVQREAVSFPGFLGCLDQGANGSTAFEERIETHSLPTPSHPDPDLSFHLCSNFERICTSHLISSAAETELELVNFIFQGL